MLVVLICSLICMVTGIPYQASLTPQHVHLSYGDDSSQMVVTWMTFTYLDESFVQYGFLEMNMKARATVRMFEDKSVTRYIYRATMTDLKPTLRYRYHVGSPFISWSNVFSFVSPGPSSNYTPWIAVFGDMGSVNAQSLPRLQSEVAKRTLDAVFHIGDFAYDLQEKDGQVGDDFMAQIESIAAYVPYMTCPGNHENYMNFTHYINRFTMPRDDGKMYYSFNLGRAHIISLNTEAYYYKLSDKSAQKQAQKEWLIKDLQIANQPANRAEYPWIITLGHRPMYCAINDGDDCDKILDLLRVDLEEILYKYGVDLELWAHEHEYQRLWPLYNYTLCNEGQSKNVHVNPQAPVHITTGSAGCRERHDRFLEPPDWVVRNVLDYGYTRLQVINSTHLYLQQISDDKFGAVMDELTIIQTQHGAGNFKCNSTVKV